MTALLAAPALALSACADSTDVDDSDITDEAVEEAPEEFGVAVDNIANERAVGVDAAVPALEDLGDLQQVDLGDTMGACAFTMDDKTLLLAGSPAQDRARGTGVIQVAGRDRVLAGSELGGPDAISAGPTMTDGEYTVQIERASAGTEADAETMGYEATLLVRKDGANEVSYGPGTWMCGV
ncbi:hypothetical protein D6201_03670 [Aurantiacibacter aquimixticola]|uniref:Uncharacterized protein n=2 Tax=Aurantiacibacter aquimixticola TaxID=1958945 RepID=A0A419RS18_9SPHN|nr:hypothetical protein D6201_03670 [Aurantiacibacter aquimixticola]